LNQLERLQRDVPRIAVRAFAVDICQHRALDAANLTATEGLAPDREKVGERQRSLGRGFDVDDGVITMRVEPSKTYAARHKRSFRAAGSTTPDRCRLVRDTKRPPRGVDDEVGVDVVCKLLPSIAGYGADRRVPGASPAGALAITRSTSVPSQAIQSQTPRRRAHLRDDGITYVASVDVHDAAFRPGLPMSRT
jgi:hypothetical protein